MDFILGFLAVPAIAVLIAGVFVAQSQLVFGLIHFACIVFIIIAVAICILGLIGCWQSDRFLITKVFDTPIILSISFAQILLIKDYCSHLCDVFITDKIEYLCSLIGGMFVLCALLLADLGILYMAGDKDDSMPGNILCIFGFLCIYGVIMAG